MASGGKRENSGRRKGVKNILCDKYRDLIAESNPIEFLINAFTKGYILTPDMSGQILTDRERCDIARDLLKKIMPDLKAIDHQGDISLDGNIDSSITVKFITAEAKKTE